MLASVYSYRVMVKSVSSCCVRGRRVLSNPVTNSDHNKSEGTSSQLEIATYLTVIHQPAK